MTATALQNELIGRIPSIGNISVLEQISFILKQNEEPIMLSDFQKKLILKSEDDIKKGNVIEHSVAMNTIAKKYGW